MQPSRLDMKGSEVCFVTAKNEPDREDFLRKAQILVENVPSIRKKPPPPISSFVIVRA